MLLLFVMSIPIISVDRQNYETIPLSFHAALNELRRWIHFHTERLPGNIEPNELRNYITRSENEKMVCETGTVFTERLRLVAYLTKVISPSAVSPIQMMSIREARVYRLGH
jgi:hypothetical protein